MPAPRGSTFDRLLRELGGILEGSQGGRGKARAARSRTEAPNIAASWIMGRALRPRHINWPRLVAATATGVILGEVLEAVISPGRVGRRLPPGRSRVLDVDEMGEDFDGLTDEELEAVLDDQFGAPPRDGIEEDDTFDDMLDADLDDLAPDSGHEAEEAPADLAAAGLPVDEDADFEDNADDEEDTDLEEDADFEDDVDEDEELEPGPRSRRHRLARYDANGTGDSSAQVRRVLERAGGDLAVAATYASVIYPRLPGPAWFRAAVFGAADIAVAGSGGIAAAVAGLSPRARLPLERLLPDEERRVEHAVGLALALALIYRDEEDDED